MLIQGGLTDLHPFSYVHVYVKVFLLVCLHVGIRAFPCLAGRFHLHDRTNTTWTVPSCMTAAKVKVKSNPKSCLFPHATRLALYLSTFPSASVFVSKTHLLWSMCDPPGGTTTVHTPLSFRARSSFLMALAYLSFPEIQVSSSLFSLILFLDSADHVNDFGVENFITQVDLISLC